jgi:hypothetical protein
MTEPPRREDVIGLLNKLGSDRDEEVLEAAREVHARITAAGASWEELLVPDESVAEDDSDAVDSPDLEEETTPTAAEAGAKNAESIALIDKLLAKSDISTDLREELEGYKTDIAEGEFEDRDRRYVSAVFARMSKRR